MTRSKWGNSITKLYQTSLSLPPVIYYTIVVFNLCFCCLSPLFNLPPHQPPLMPPPLTRNTLNDKGQNRDGDSLAGRASDWKVRRNTDMGLSPRCGNGSFSQSQLSLQTLLPCLYSLCVKLHASTSVCMLKIPNVGSHTIKLKKHNAFFKNIVVSFLWASVHVTVFLFSFSWCSIACYWHHFM